MPYDVQNALGSSLEGLKASRKAATVEDRTGSPALMTFSKLLRSHFARCSGVVFFVTSVYAKSAIGRTPKQLKSETFLKLGQSQCYANKGEGIK